MSEKEFEEIKALLLGVLECKTQAHRKLAIGMVISVIEAHLKTGKGEDHASENQR